MRAAIVFCLMLCACGDWSNEDLEYLYALPQKDLLKSDLGDGMSGQGLRRDPLLGDTPKFYPEAKAYSTVFNTFVDGVLAGLDMLRTIHPTKREPTKRIWGPWPDDKHPGFDIKVEIEKTGDKRYQWRIQARKRGAAEFVTFGGGRFVASESLRKGRGDFFFDAVASNALYGTSKAKPEDPDRVDFGYSTDADPVIVQLEMKVPSLAVPVRYDLNRHADGAGIFAFTVEGLPDPNATKVMAFAGWSPTGAGRISYTVLAGNYAGAVAMQCLDTSEKVVFETANWPGAVPAGRMEDCVAVPEFKSLPDFPP